MRKAKYVMNADICVTYGSVRILDRETSLETYIYIYSRCLNLIQQ